MCSFEVMISNYNTDLPYIYNANYVSSPPTYDYYLTQGVSGTSSPYNPYVQISCNQQFSANNSYSIYALKIY